MSHPVTGFDYTEKHNEETEKEYRARVRAGTKKTPNKKAASLALKKKKD